MEKYKKFKFVILIPVYHSQDLIKELNNQILKYLQNENFFICFVDDSKNNETLEKINFYFKSNFVVLKRKKEENFSTRYSASMEGFVWIKENINSKYVVEIDADLAHHPKDIMKGIKILSETNADLVIGSKYQKKSIVKNRPISRKFISKTITMICQFLFSKRISDYTNTFRFYNMKLVRDFTLNKIIFKSPIGHLNNLLYIIKKKYNIKEIETEYVETNNESMIKFSELGKYLYDFLRCIFINKIR